MNESERFSAAAIAFAWKHDSHFRNHFWKSVCSFDADPKLSDKAKIQVEPYRWADLLITNPTKRGLFVYVVERKIHAGLVDIQNPAKRKSGRANGYGDLFHLNFGFPGQTLRLVLLGFPGKLNFEKPPWTLPIRVQQRDWETLASSIPEESPISKDLAISLGMLGIGAFPAAEVKGMKVNTELNEFAMAASILREVERRLAWPQGRSKPARFQFYKGNWYLGVELLTSDKDPARSLERFVHPPGIYLAWFGYLGEEGGTPSLGVWLYCGDDETRKKLAKLCRTVPGCSVDVSAAPEYKQFHLIVSAHRHSLDADCKWFCDVFHKLGVIE